jgi:hypothetical protein
MEAEPYSFFNSAREWDLWSDSRYSRLISWERSAGLKAGRDD